MSVSALSSLQGNPAIALGNAYGSNIANIALILGLAALISPIAVHSDVLRKELPILTLVTFLAGFQLWDGGLSRIDAYILLLVFAGLMGWTIWQGVRRKDDNLAVEIEQAFKAEPIPLGRAFFWLVVGLIVLVASSRVLVWGAVALAHSFGVSDLIVGLTVVAIGTSLPELASSLIAARKGEHDIALGNVLGSNLFNTLAVVGIAGVIKSRGRAGRCPDPGSAGYGNPNPVPVRDRLRFSRSGTDQPPRGRPAPGGFPGLHGLAGCRAGAVPDPT